MRAGRLIAAITPLLPIFALVVAAVTNGAKRWP
jgi:hypothetical protein